MENGLTMQISTPFSGAKKPLLLVLGFIVCLFAIGCGGLGFEHINHVRKGKILFNVTWPVERNTRVIPTTAQSLVVQIKNGATLVDSQIILKPAVTTTFPEIPVGAMTVEVTAYATTDGTGTALAHATVPTTIVANTTVTVDITLASTIDHLDISPSPMTLAAQQSGSITVTARDVSNAVVLVDSASISYSSSAPSIASVDSSGTVTAGSSVGTATITITEADSGKTATTVVTVVPNISVSPTASGVTIRGTKQFTATVIGPVNTSVTWSVTEGGGGTINASGLYTAPSAKGTYHVVATSVADPTRTATATITVSSGGVTVNVH